LRKLRASWVFYSTVEKSVEKNVDAGIDSLKQRSTNTFNHLVDGVEKNVDAGIDSLKQRSTNTFNHLVDGVEKNVDAGIDSLKQRSTNTFNHFVDGVDDFSEFFETTNQTSSVVDSSVKADVNKNMALNIDSIDTIDTSSGSIEIALSQTVDAFVDATIDNIDTNAEVPQIEVGASMSQSVDAFVDVTIDSIDTSAEVPQIEVGALVTHSDSYHKRGSSSGVVEAINETGEFVVNWAEDGDNQVSKAQRTYSADELRLLANG
jgi:hypothetical protein